jgi:hypothetical protein
MPLHQGLPDAEASKRSQANTAYPIQGRRTTSTGCNQRRRKSCLPFTIEAPQPAFRLQPASDSISLGSFVRDGRTVLLLVNVGTEAYLRLKCSARFAELNGHGLARGLQFVPSHR